MNRAICPRRSYRVMGHKTDSQMLRLNHVQIALEIISSVCGVGRPELAHEGVGVCIGVHAEKLPRKEQLELQRSVAFERLSDYSVECELGNIGR